MFATPELPANLPQDPNADRPDEPNRVQHIHQIDLNDQSYSPAFRRGENRSIEDLQREFRNFVRYEQTRAAARNIFEAIDQGQVPNEADLSTLGPANLQHLSSYEKGQLVGALIQSGGGLACERCAEKIIKVVGNEGGAELEEAQAFFRGLDARGVNLGGVLAAPINPQAVIALAASFVDVKLKELGSQLTDQELKTHFSAEELSLRERVHVLTHVSSEKRLEFIRSVFEAAESNPFVERFLAAKLDNIANFLTTAEKITLSKELLGTAEKDSSRAQLFKILRSSKNLEELTAIVKAVEAEKLLALEAPAIHEMVAKAVLMPALKGVEMPGISAATEKAALDENLDAIAKALAQMKTLVEARTELKHTDTVKEFLEAIEYNTNYLNSLRTRIGDEVEGLRYLSNLMQEKLDIEVSYGVVLRHTDSHMHGPYFIPGAHWSLDQVQGVRKALETLPEGLVITTPLLKDIKRVSVIVEAEGALGIKKPDGSVELANSAVNHRMLEALYPGTSSLTYVLVHELGHSIQIGENHAMFLQHAETGKVVFAPGDPRYDFREFAKIAGWTIIDDSRWEVKNVGFSVVLDGEEYRVGVPIRHKDQDLMLFPMRISADKVILVSMDAHAGFTVRPYSMTNPWEDWAEAFAEYMLAPERLIYFAPKKFQFIEEEFGKYADREDLKQKVAEAIARREAKYGKK